jgi:hypothetical protein
MPTRENFQIIFVGTIQPTETKLKKILQVRRRKIMNALTWLKNNNELYKNVYISHENLSNLPTDDVPKKY